MSSNLILSKFRGSLLGGLLGDCLGAPFEGESSLSATQINLYFSQLFDSKVRVPFKPYTDDTVMTKAVAENLIKYKKIYPSELAKRFTTDYFMDPKRGYGQAVHDVFVNLRNAGFDDPFYQARKQFGGSGSFGNGAAMRSSPIALFTHFHKNTDKLIEYVNDASRITHSNPLGVQGAILQTLAVREALKKDPKTDPIEPMSYLDTLIEEMSKIEKSDLEKHNEDSLKRHYDGSSLYSKKLETVKKYLKKTKYPLMEELHEDLGVHVSAFNSVPTSIYCFLLAQNPIVEIEAENPFVRSIQFAISLGGDTDTISSMTGSMSGAYFGQEAVPDILIKHTEKPDDILRIADELHKVASEN